MTKSFQKKTQEVNAQLLNFRFIQNETFYIYYFGI